MSDNAAEARMRDDAALVEHAFRTIIGIYTEVAAGSDPDAALSLLAWATADGVTAAARLSAVADIPAPEEDIGEPPLFDMDPLRRGLANALAGMDTYYELDDAYDEDASLIAESIVESILTAVSAWRTALFYLDTKGPQAALWWSQYSALTMWGDRISSAMRMIMLLLSQARLTSDGDVSVVEQLRQHLDHERYTVPPAGRVAAAAVPGAGPKRKPQA
jgi:hypothetical protein